MSDKAHMHDSGESSRRHRTNERAEQTRETAGGGFKCHRVNIGKIGLV